MEVRRIGFDFTNISAPVWRSMLMRRNTTTNVAHANVRTYVKAEAACKSL